MTLSTNHDDRRTASQPTDLLFRALTDGDRRAVLCALGTADRALRLEDLAAALAERGQGASSDDFAATLHHRHLPLLTRAGLVDVRPDDCTVTRRPEADVVPPLLALAEAAYDR